tara:strand:- start:83 stop:679 length:597 start_codon:yes stop_codon:yes gene_type:complete
MTKLFDKAKSQFKKVGIVLEEGAFTSTLETVCDVIDDVKKEGSGLFDDMASAASEFKEDVEREMRNQDEQAQEPEQDKREQEVVALIERLNQFYNVPIMEAANNPDIEHVAPTVEDIYIQLNGFARTLFGATGIPEYRNHFNQWWIESHAAEYTQEMSQFPEFYILADRTDVHIVMAEFLLDNPVAFARVAVLLKENK